ncbi:coiled-coil domain-containing protein [Marinactinospora thermotolerans]|uniref:coiled-coil domain-containing protein n=1 Tax=Marinactinospora thermotolerans TaxID=531310 RepID=UPI003D93E609
MPTRRRRAMVFAGLAAAFALAVPAPAYADPGDEVDIEELNERAEKLEEEYDSELVQYTSAKEGAQKAQDDLDEINKRMEEARQGVSQIAASQYKSSGLNPTMEVVFSSSPDEMLGDAALVDHLADSNGERVLSLADLRAEAEKAKEKADGKLKEAEELIEDLEEQRDEVLDKIEKYEAEQTPEPAETGSSGGSGDGTVPASAIGPGWDGATPRMAAIRDEIVREFGAPFPVGCLRPGDPGEHGSGRACDFMMSANGGMPSAANQQLGTQIAEYAKNNADRLGVMYVIWEQRIWDSRNPGAGWKPMEDRGSITQNHYDHVHVSSY